MVDGDVGGNLDVQNANTRQQNKFNSRAHELWIHLGSWEVWGTLKQAQTWELLQPCYSI